MKVSPDSADSDQRVTEASPPEQRRRGKMSLAGDTFVRCCNAAHNMPAAVLCVLISMLQMGILDYYLVSLLSIRHLAWLALDFVVLIVLVLSMRKAHHVQHGHHHDSDAGGEDLRSWAWAAWLLKSASVCAKVSVIVVYGVEELEAESETDSIWGPNTLKTSIALGSCTFLLLLITQHDAPLGSEGRRYIEELTGLVVFDLLDTVEILDTLFELEERNALKNSLEDVILAVAIVNLLIPTVPLFTLARTQFGRKKLRKRLVYLHRLTVVLAVNVPNLVVRIVLWHAYSRDISPFTLKNIVLIGITLYEFYEHKKEKFELHEQEKMGAVGAGGAGGAGSGNESGGELLVKEASSPDRAHKRSPQSELTDTQQAKRPRTFIQTVSDGTVQTGPGSGARYDSSNL